MCRAGTQVPMKQAGLIVSNENFFDPLYCTEKKWLALTPTANALGIQKADTEMRMRGLSLIKNVENDRSIDADEPSIKENSKTWASFLCQYPHSNQTSSTLIPVARKALEASIAKENNP